MTLGCYMPLKAKVFEENPKRVEEAFTGLAEIIKEALRATLTDERLIERIRGRIEVHRRRETFQSVLDSCVEVYFPRKNGHGNLLTVKVCGLIRTLHFVQGRNPA